MYSFFRISQLATSSVPNSEAGVGVGKCTYQLPTARENPALNQGNGASMGKRHSPISLEGNANCD